MPRQAFVKYGVQALSTLSRIVESGYMKPLARASSTGSSHRWKAREQKDIFFKQAAKEGLRSRSAYKLKEIIEKHKIIRPGQVVIDLGAAPGGWSQVAAKVVHKTHWKRSPTGESMSDERKPENENVGISHEIKKIEGRKFTGRTRRRGVVIAVDLLPISPLEEDVVILEGDFRLAAIRKDVVELMEGREADAVINDMAPSFSGHHSMDHARQIILARQAAKFALCHLKDGGNFVTKVLQGEDEPLFFSQLRKHFAVVKRVKPSASRAESTEIFIVAKGFKQGNASVKHDAARQGKNMPKE